MARKEIITCDHCGNVVEFTDRRVSFDNVDLHLKCLNDINGLGMMRLLQENPETVVRDVSNDLFSFVRSNRPYAFDSDGALIRVKNFPLANRADMLVAINEAFKLWNDVLGSREEDRWLKVMGEL